MILPFLIRVFMIMLLLIQSPIWRWCKARKANELLIYHKHKKPQRHKDTKNFFIFVSLCLCGLIYYCLYRAFFQQVGEDLWNRIRSELRYSTQSWLYCWR